MRRHLFRIAPCVLFAVGSAARANDLLDFYHLAQTQDTTLRAAGYQRDVAVEAAPQARAALLPQLSAEAEYSRNRLHELSVGGTSVVVGVTSPQERGIAYYTSKNYSLNLSQAIFDWSAFETLWAASQTVAQAQASYRSAEQSLIYRVADAYFTVLNALDAFKSDTDARNSYQQQLQQAQKKFDVGLAAITDVRNAQAAYDASVALVIADQRALDSARRALWLIIGKSTDDIARLQDEIPLAAPDPAGEEDWVQAAARDNPDLMSAFHAAEAARNQLAAARAKFLPTLSLVGSVGRQNSSSQFGSDSISDLIGLQANWALFEGGLRVSLARQAHATYDEDLANYEGTRRTVEKSTRDAYEGVISGIASVKANQQAVVSNQTSLEASQVGLRVGTRTQVDVLTAQQALSAAQRAYFQARYDYLRSVLALKQEAGRLTEADLAGIDRLLVAAGTPPAPVPSKPPAAPEKPVLVPEQAPLEGTPVALPQRRRPETALGYAAPVTMRG